MKQLEAYIHKGGKRLRMGYTTGSCAAAAAKAAATMLLCNESVAVVSLTVPKGLVLELDIEQACVLADSVTCAVRKDAGDDPDVTDGMLIFASVSKTAQGFVVDGGEGVGRVTRPGLACHEGEAAINPVPRQQIQEALAQVAAKAGYNGGVLAIISAENGQAVARKTFNPRLGITGGISILGTSGIVEPMSEAALVATVQADIAAHRAARETILLLTPGNYGRDFARHQLNIHPDRAVRCSNYMGEALDHAVYCGFRKILLLGHMGKLTKLAAGIMNTHSAVADGRMEIIAAHAAMAGLDADFVRELFACVAVEAADELLLCRNMAEKVWGSVAERIALHIRYRVGEPVDVAFAGFLGRGIVLASPRYDKMLSGLLAPTE